MLVEPIKAQKESVQSTSPSPTERSVAELAGNSEVDERKKPGRTLKYTPVTKLIEIDFKDKGEPQISIDDDIEEGEYFQIVIYNINQNLWKVSFNKADSVLSKRQQTPTFGAFELDAISKVIAGISPLSTSTSLWTANLKIMEDLNKTSMQLDGIPPLEKVAAPFRGIKDEIETERKVIAQYLETTKETANSIDNLKLKIYKRRLNSYTLENNVPENFDFSQALTSIEDSRSKIDKLSEEVVDSKQKYEKFSEDNETEIADNTDLTKADKSIKEAYSGFLSTLTTMKSTISSDKANELLAPLVMIENNKDNDYVSLPIQFMGEQTNLQLSIVPRDDKFAIHSYVIPITYPTRIRKYTSAGISFYTASIYDRSYATIETPVTDSTSVFSFEEEDVDKAELGLAAMLRFGMKTGEKNNFGYHGSIGAGISMSNKIKPRALFGGGLSFGKKHMLSADLGLIVGYVDKHSERINEEDVFIKTPSNLTVSRIGVGVFMSVGYLYQF